MLEVDWDEVKASRNIRSHGIKFTTAARVFLDANLIEVLDDRADYGEERWNVLGLVGREVLHVTYTLREGGRVAWLISARFAERREVDEYYTRFIG